MGTKRLFVAIPLSEELKDAITAQKRAIKLTQARFVDPDKCHVTLLFLGDVQEENIPKIHEILKRETALIQPFVLHFHNVSFGPKPKRPRLLWMEAEKNDSFILLGKKLHTALIEFIEKEEEREPHAHITVARLPHFHLQGDEKLPSFDFKPLPVEKCLLIESALTYKGPLYTILYEYRLCEDTVL